MSEGHKWVNQSSFLLQRFQLRCQARLFNSMQMKIPIPFLGPERTPGEVRWGQFGK